MQTSKPGVNLACLRWGIPLGLLGWSPLIALIVWRTL